MDLAKLQEQMGVKRQELGQRYADLPEIESKIRADLFGQDNTLSSLQGNEKSKILELYEHDKALADTYSNPQHASYMEDPYAREKARATRFQGTAGELVDIQNQTQKRRDVLGTTLEKALKMLQYGLEAQRLEYSGMQDEFNNGLQLAEFNFKKSEAGKGTQADQQKVAYTQMVSDLKKRITLPEALVRYGQYFAPDEIYAAYNQVNNDPNRKANYGPAKETPEVLQRYGIAPPEGNFGSDQWEIAAGVSGKSKNSTNMKKAQDYLTLSDRAKLAQEAIDTSGNKTATKAAIVKDNPDLAPYLKTK